MAQDTPGYLRTESISRVGWLALGLVFVTGVLHVYAGVVEGRVPVALAGVGFFGAMVLYLVDYRRRLLYLVGILYTGVQIPLWYVANQGAFTTVGYVDKTVQVVLVALLAYLYWNSRASDGTRSGTTGTGQAG